MDLLVTNANVADHGRRSGAPASAVAIRAGKIVAVGRDRDVLAFRQPGMRIIDAGGRTVLPGFIEPHNHMVGYATALIGVDARTPPNETIADIVARLRQAAATLPPHRWILGRGYDDTGLRDMRHPTRRDLDQASTEHPIVIWHNSGHLLVANSQALALAGITATTEDPPGGRIGRFEGTAEPDGVLYEAPAQTLVSRLDPRLRGRPSSAAAFGRAQDEFLRQGVTTIHDAHVSRLRGIDILDTYRQMHAGGRLKLRGQHVHAVGLSQESWTSRWRRARATSGLPVAGCKIVSDALHPGHHRGAARAVLLPRGREGLAHLRAGRARRDGPHARTGVAIRSPFTPTGTRRSTPCSPRTSARCGAVPRADHRHRIEHCQVCHPGAARADPPARGHSRTSSRTTSTTGAIATAIASSAPTACACWIRSARPSARASGRCSTPTAR